MKQSSIIVRIIILSLALILLLPLKGLQIKQKYKRSRYLSEQIDISKPGVHFFSIDKRLWPEIDEVEENILEVALLLNNSDSVACQKDIQEKSRLVLAISDSVSHFNRLIFTSNVPNDTLQLSDLSTYTPTSGTDYHFSIPIAYICHFAGDAIKVKLEIIKEDSLLNSLEPRISVRKYRDLYGDDYFTNMFFNLFLYIICGLIFLVILLDIIYLCRRKNTIR